MVRVFKAFAQVLAGATMAGAAVLGTATAQTANGFPGQGGVFNTVNTADIRAILAELEISSEIGQSDRPGQAPSVIATLSSGARFVVGMFQCEDVAAASGCKQILITTAQPAAGTSFDDMNAFNGVSNVTTVVYDGGNQLLLFGRSVFVPGGLGRDNLKLSVALFLNDMQKFVESRRGSTASVSFNVTPELDVDPRQSKITSISSIDVDPQVQKLLISSDGSLEVEMAINNSVDKSYKIEFDLVD